MQVQVLFWALFLFFLLFVVYAISSTKRNYIYVGLTNNLEKRLLRHNRGYEKSTRLYAPFKLIYTETCNTRPEAREREKYWKSGTGKEKLRDLRAQADAGLSADR
ncbi:MAG: GIY-YIG nuclease family protein [Owenweeksia sp.]